MPQRTLVQQGMYVSYTNIVHLSGKMEKMLNDRHLHNSDLMCIKMASGSVCQLLYLINLFLHFNLYTTAN